MTPYVWQITRGIAVQSRLKRLLTLWPKTHDKCRRAVRINTKATTIASRTKDRQVISLPIRGKAKKRILWMPYCLHLAHPTMTVDIVVGQARGDVGAVMDSFPTVDVYDVSRSGVERDRHVAQF